MWIRKQGLWGLGKGDEDVCRTLRLKRVLGVSKDVCRGELRNRVCPGTGMIRGLWWLEPGHCREVRFLKMICCKSVAPGIRCLDVDLRNAAGVILSTRVRPPDTGA